MQILRRTNLEALKKSRKIGADKVIDLLIKKGLTGRGGAAFSTGQKWKLVRQQKKKGYLIVNADEGEPGTFKDKFIMENNPELLVEGILIAAYCINAKQVFFYLREEYSYLKKELEDTIKKILKKSKSKINIDIVLGAGAYVCGEETAIIQSIEGLRGQPYYKPPYPTTKGLFGKPTVINNVETLANVPLAMFDNWNPNLRLYSLSGNVTNPGIYELPLGIKLGKLIELGKPRNRIKAVYFGCSGGCMPYSYDIELSPEKICKEECMLGSCSIIAVDETKSIVDLSTNIAKFYEFESCGKCTPCREGTMRVMNLLQNISLGKAKKKDLDTLKELAEVIKETSLCGLGQTSTNHVLNALKYFRKEFEEKLCKQ